jgi:very-short-patch-repair endonuclease
VKDLKHYLEFAITGPRALVAQVAPTGLGPDSPFESAVAGMLRDKGWVVHPQVGCSGYRIDMAVVDPRAPGRYLLGIECDGASYHSGATARDRDRLRQHILERLGWRLHRIWSTDWWFDAPKQLENLQARLQELVTEAVLDDQPEAEPSIAQSESEERAPLFAGLHSEPVAPAPAPTLPRYVPAAVSGGQADLFYEPRAFATIKDSIAKLIAEEGPVLDAVVFRRVARAWGLERTGSRIVERLKSAIPRDAIRTRDGKNTFYWPAGAAPERWNSFRIAGDDENSRRRVDEVALEEIAAIVQHLLEQSGSSTSEDIARTTCRLLGMARTPADAEARVGAAVKMLIDRGVIHKDGSYLRP